MKILNDEKTELIFMKIKFHLNENIEWWKKWIDFYEN